MWMIKALVSNVFYRINQFSKHKNEGIKFGSNEDLHKDVINEEDESQIHKSERHDVVSTPVAKKPLIEEVKK